MQKSSDPFDEYLDHALWNGLDEEGNDQYVFFYFLILMVLVMLMLE